MKILVSVLLFVAALCAQSGFTIVSGPSKQFRYVQSSSPSSCALNDLWLDTSANTAKRCTTAGTPGTWTALALNGVAVTGTPSSGQVPVASSSTAAAWGPITAAMLPMVPITRASTAAGLYSGTYTSGITASGTGTCTLSSFNGGGTGAAATIAVTSGTPGAITVTAAGSGYTTAPTTATAGSGTATCSGTATIATVLGITASAAGYYINDNAAPLTLVLPTITSGLIGWQACLYNGMTRTSALTVKAPASTYIDFQGENKTAAGTLVSTGALGDAVCVLGSSTTQYKAFTGSGVWVNN